MTNIELNYITTVTHTLFFTSILVELLLLIFEPFSFELLVRTNFLDLFPLLTILLLKKKKLLFGLFLPLFLLLYLLFPQFNIAGGEAVIRCSASRKKIQFLCFKCIVGRFARLRQ